MCDISNSNIGYRQTCTHCDDLHIAAASFPFFHVQIFAEEHLYAKYFMQVSQTCNIHDNNLYSLSSQPLEQL